MPNHPLRTLRALLLLPPLILIGCGGGAELVRTALDEGGAEPGAELTLLLSRAPELEHFPFPRDAGEALVFAQLYETLTVLDPEGRARPGLAASWRSEDGGRRWIFTLREDATFWGGRRVTPEAVIAGWLHTRRLSQRLGLRLPLLPGKGGLRLGLAGEGRLRIELASPRPDLPALLARPYLAVSAGTEPLRLGSGPCMPAAVGGDTLICLPHGQHPRPALWRRLNFVAIDPLALPDLGPAGADGLLLEDAHLDPYLAEEPGLRSHSLPAERLYGLLLPPGETLGYGRWREVLHDDLQRGLLPLAALESIDPRLSSWMPAPEGERRAVELELALDEGDLVALILGRRVAALASAPSSGAGAVRVLGLSADVLAARLRSLSTGEFDQPFLLGLWSDSALPAGSGTFRPLAILRPRLVLKDSLRGLELGGDGWPRLDRLGPVTAGEDR